MGTSLLSRIRDAIRQENLDGWLFYNFRHRDTLADQILRVDQSLSNTRPWIYAVPVEGVPCRIVHRIEAGILDALDGTTTFYSSREELHRALEPLAGRTWAVHASETLPVLSFLDAGTVDLLRRAGLRLTSAETLVQRLQGLLDDSRIASHRRAAVKLYGIVQTAWDAVREAYAREQTIREGDIRSLILSEMDRLGLQTDHPPIVASGAHSGDPHYDFNGCGAPFAHGDIVQLDMWAKEHDAEAIYADISWVGVFAEKAAEEQTKAFAALIAARDSAVEYIRRELDEGKRPSGAAVDRRTRDILREAGYEDALRHRTGHGIDTECHGSGANLDSIEFPDSRLLLDGSCFSIEPGVYFSTFGLRTEIDVYIQSGQAIVSGADIQHELLTCRRRAF